MHLPSDGAFYASRRGGSEFRGWDVDRYALVALVNAQRANNYILTMVNRDSKKSAPKPPEPFHTPDADVASKDNNNKPGSFGSIAASMMAAQRRKRELRNV